VKLLCGKKSGGEKMVF